MFQRRGAREFAGLLVLFVLLIGFAAFYEQVGQERVASNAPTTTNTHSDGIRALYLLYQREGLRKDTLKSPWNDLRRDDGMLVFVEPPDSERPINRSDLKVLENWIRGGGTLLDLVSDPPVRQPLDPTNPVRGDCGADAAASIPQEVLTDPSTSSALLNGVHSLFVNSRQRLIVAKGAPYAILARDTAGIVAVEKPLGQGSVVLVANRFSATNAGIQQADNAIFLYNIALHASAGKRRVIQFDDYHHGAGFAQQTAEAQGNLWQNMPIPLRLAFLQFGAVGLLLLYNSNRRFGPPRGITSVTMRSSTDYVNSMARLYRRAGAADIAAEALYLRFLRDLKRALDLPNDAGIAAVVRAAEHKFGAKAEGLNDLLLRGEAIVAGQRIHEAYMLHFAKQIEHFRKGCEFVGV